MCCQLSQSETVRASCCAVSLGLTFAGAAPAQPEAGGENEESSLLLSTSERRRLKGGPLILITTRK